MKFLSLDSKKFAATYLPIHNANGIFFWSDGRLSVKSIILGLLEISSSLKESFLVPKVSRLSGASRPLDLPRVAPSNAGKIDVLVVSQQPSNANTKVKKNRQSDEDSPLPGMNDIITGEFDA